MEKQQSTGNVVRIRAQRKCGLTLIFLSLLLGSCAVGAAYSADDYNCFEVLAKRQYETEQVIAQIQENLEKPQEYVALKVLRQFGYDYLLLGVSKERGYILAYHSLTGVSSHDIDRGRAVDLISDIEAAVGQSADSPGVAAFHKEGCAMIRVVRETRVIDRILHNEMFSLEKESEEMRELDKILRNEIGVQVPNPFTDEIVDLDPPFYSKEKVDAYVRKLEIDIFPELAGIW